MAWTSGAVVLAASVAEVAYLVVGLAMLGAAIVPRLLARRPLSFPIVYVAVGAALFALPLGLPRPDPLGHVEAARRLTEVVVIVSLMGVGLRIDRPVGLRTWGGTWRLLAVAMPLSIAAVALLGWLAGLVPASALLLGAVLAPTDPVLADDVQVDPPGSGNEDEVRFVLTSEAGLNDALAFPVTYAALAAASAGPAAAWIGEWLWSDVVVKLSVGLVVGLVCGRLLAWVIFRWPEEIRPARSADGFVALAATFCVYGLAEVAGGYGFLAVFVSALTLRGQERHHRHHRVLHEYAEITERLLTAVLLVLLGGAVVTGALAALEPVDVVVALAVVLVVRPLAGWVALVGRRGSWRERGAIAFFGIRGMGSLYYLAFASATATVVDEARVWSLALLVVVLSVVVHGLSATPIMERVDRLAARDQRRWWRRRPGGAELATR